MSSLPGPPSYRERVQDLASIPSPTHSVWHLGPLPIRAYALCIIVGILVAIWLTTRRWRERGGNPDHVWDVAAWAIVLGIIGGRVYHVVTDPELYFDKGRHPIDAFKIWDGGLGIWGAVALGAVGAWIGCRRKGVKLAVYADALAPGLVLAQGIGRWGNWFNNELYGGPTSVPWKLQIHCVDVTVGRGQVCPNGSHVLGYFQPTFLYESLWDIALAIGLIYLDRRRRMGNGTVIFTYAMGYTVGRLWIEALRSDKANHILGLRLNIWTCIVVFVIALVCFLRRGGFHAERETTPYTAKRLAREGGNPDAPADEPSDETTTDAVVQAAATEAPPGPPTDTSDTVE
jgi:prolipoprotein diacylglyceryl transferase